MKDCRTRWLYQNRIVRDVGVSKAKCERETPHANTFRPEADAFRHEIVARPHDFLTIVTIRLIRSRAPGWPPLLTFSGRENPLASHPLWLGSASRLTLALDSLSLTSPSRPRLSLPGWLRQPTPRCTLLHQPSLFPRIFPLPGGK